MNYRKIYEQYYGPIPKDKDGRAYEVHHIDGDHSNNEPDNLKAVTIQEHFDIHLAQGDWAACQAIAIRMDKPTEEISDLAKKRVKDGIHNFQTRPDGTSLQTDRVAAGTHHWLKRPDGTSIASDRVIAGTNPFLGPGINLKRTANKTHYGYLGVLNGTHHFLTNNPSKNWKEVKCPYCPITGKGSNMKRYHFDNCKHKGK